MFEGHSSAWLEIRGVKARIAVDQLKAIERTFVYAEPTPFGSDEPFRIIERTRYDGTLQIGNESVHYRLTPRELPTPRGWIRARIFVIREHRPSSRLPGYLGARNVKASTFHDVLVKARRFVDWKALAKRSTLMLDREERDFNGRSVDPIWQCEGLRFAWELARRYRVDQINRRWVRYYRDYRTFHWPDRVPTNYAEPGKLAALLDQVGRWWRGPRDL
ncbi:hypothetical protein [Singulisphaera sp. PoT]|uniref:hypothetical protein n=1 Tax=Singulisphaera sp. PoT TaxID=3411797 RepID=UPI003BF5A2D7